MHEMTVPANLSHLAEVTAFVEGILEESGCPLKTIIQVNIAVEEIFVNIAHYAYAPGDGDATVRCRVDGHCLTIWFLDQGIPYDPLGKDDPDITLDATEREIGGLGIYMVKKSMDRVAYEYTDGRNILSIEKRW